MGKSINKVDEIQEIDFELEELDEFSASDTEPIETNQKESKESNFISAIQRVLSKPSKKSNPILSNNTIESRIDQKKLEAAAEKILHIKQKCPSMRVIPVFDENDRKMKRIATRGVVQLFNAIRSAQKTVDSVVEDTIQKHSQSIPEIAKNSFMASIKKPNHSENVVKEEVNVDWMKNDFVTKEAKAKHWDEEDDE